LRRGIALGSPVKNSLGVGSLMVFPRPPL